MELPKNFDPSQENYEPNTYNQHTLERPFNMADGGRIGFKDRGYVKMTPKYKSCSLYKKRFNAAKAAKEAYFNSLVDKIFETERPCNF